jgi:hypothetical protein
MAYHECLWPINGMHSLYGSNYQRSTLSQRHRWVLAGFSRIWSRCPYSIFDEHSDKLAGLLSGPLSRRRRDAFYSLIIYNCCVSCAMNTMYYWLPDEIATGLGVVVSYLRNDMLMRQPWSGAIERWRAAYMTAATLCTEKLLIPSIIVSITGAWSDLYGQSIGVRYCRLIWFCLMTLKRVLQTCSARWNSNSTSRVVGGVEVRCLGAVAIVWIRVEMPIFQTFYWLCSI